MTGGYPGLVLQYPTLKSGASSRQAIYHSLQAVVQLAAR